MQTLNSRLVEVPTTLLDAKNLRYEVLEGHTSKLPPDGEWYSEPDHVTWYEPSKNLMCMIHRNHGGALCGYVGFPEGHPLHQKRNDYDSGDYIDIKGFHSGVTYSDSCQGSLCHVAQEGEPEHVFWHGFDCYDYCPNYSFSPDEEVYRNMEYVVSCLKEAVESL